LGLKTGGHQEETHTLPDKPRAKTMKKGETYEHRKRNRPRLTAGPRNAALNKLGDEIKPLETIVRTTFQGQNQILVRMGLVRQGRRTIEEEFADDIYDDLQQDDDDAADDGEATAKPESRESAPEDAGENENATGANAAADDNATERPMREQLSEGDRKSGNRSGEDRQQNTG